MGKEQKESQEASSVAPRDRSVTPLASFNELPEWMKHNEHIRSGYLPHMSFSDSLHFGLFHIHNETCNIWTHLIGAILFMSLITFTILHLTHVDIRIAEFYSTLVHETHPFEHAADLLHATEEAFLDAFRHFPPRLIPPNLQHAAFDKAHRALTAVLFEHKMGILPLLIGAVICLLGSTVYHTLWNMGEGWMVWFSRVDYVGIIVLSIGHSMVASYYELYCRPELVLRYQVAISVVALPSILLFLHPDFFKPAWVVRRTVLFVAIGWLNALPTLHAAALHLPKGPAYDDFWAHSVYMAVAGSSYLIGAYMFARRVPEKWWPGRFDYFFNSHNFLHLFVLAGASIHFAGAVNSFFYRLEFGCSLSPLL